MKDCTTCKYGYEDERLGIPMCHHPKRFSEDCVNFNMHEEKETEESEKPIIPITVTVLDNDLNPVEITADSEAKVEPSGSSEIPKDLEEAAEKYANKEYPDETSCGQWGTGDYEPPVNMEYPREVAKDSFKAGAKWDREQMMKRAKDGWMDEEGVIILNDGTRIDLQPDYDKKPAFEFKYAQDVRVIILPKED